MNTTTELLNSENYQALFANKVANTKDDMREFEPPELECFQSIEKHFRMRAEFKMWHEDGRVFYAMYEQGKYKKPVKIDAFEIGSKTICDLMPKILEEINNNVELKTRLFQIEFLSSTRSECVITLIYHRKLGDAWIEEAKQLERTLGCKIIGRSRGQKLVISEDYIFETFDINNKTFRYQQVETGFTQPNANICQKMLTWAQDVSRAIGGDLLELYCGNGNFTLPLAENFNQVLATEVSKTSVKSALKNIKINACQNIRVVRMSSEEFTEAMDGKREFRRLKDIELQDYNFSTVFVDPPRAGLDDDTVSMVSRFDNILYISCNPQTLKDNLRTLNKTHQITRLAFFDQFPYTAHRECGVLLHRR